MKIMKVVYKLKQGEIEFDLTEKQICEFIADDLYDTSKAWRDTSRKEFVARMTEALYCNTDAYTLAMAFDLDEMADEVAAYFAGEFLDRDELHEWYAMNGYDCDDKGD